MAVIFVVGTIAVPTLHLAFHSLPHDHIGGAIHYHLGEAVSDHEEDDHDEADEPDHAEVPHHHHHHHHHDTGRNDDQHHHQPFDPRHGEGSAAHFSLALSDAAASAIAPSLPQLPEAGQPLPSAASRLVAWAHVSVQRFRGPPAG